MLMQQIMIRNSFIRWSFFTILFFSFENIFAQTPVEPIDNATEQKIEKLAENAGEDVDANTLLDKLNYYRNHHINLNHTTQQELQDLLLLNDIQIAAILSHITEFGNFLNIQELQTIDALDLETIFRILPFVTVDETQLFENISLKKIFTGGKNTVVIRGTQVMENQLGFENQNDSNYLSNKSYAGSPQKIYARYRYTFGNRISLGFTGEKDAGEQFFKGNQKQGFDFNSAHLFIKGKGLIRTLALGDYHAEYGQGVVLHSGLAFGKSADVLNIKKNARGIIPYTSADENLFLRGGALALGYKKFQLDAFYSSHKIDGHVLANADSLTAQDIISSFQTDGNHRTYSEYSNRHTVTESHIGGHLSYKSNNLTLGVTALKTKFSLPRIPTAYLYNKYDFSGDKNFNSGFDYSYLYRNVSLFGEVGRSMNGGMGYLNGALVSLDPRFALTILHRHFDRDYQALMSAAISENTRNQNETGTMIGISAKPIRFFQINAYYDMFSFPWLRYQVDAPTKGYEYLAQIDYAPNKIFDAYFRVKQQNKPEDFPGTDVLINGLQDVKQTNYRFNIRYKISKEFTLSNRIEYVTLEKRSIGIQKGYLIYQDINFKPMKSKMSVSLSYILFDTDSYDTRIYALETDVLYAYSIPSYYYRGSKYYFVVHYSIARGIDFWVRLARTSYDNQQTVGSSLDLINASHKTEVKAQIRFEF